MAKAKKVTAAKKKSPAKPVAAKKAAVKAKSKNVPKAKAAVPAKKAKTPAKAVKTKAAKPKATKTEAKIKKVRVEKSQAEILAEAAIHGILEKKGKNVLCMDLQNVPNAVCDFFIICEAESTRQVSAIADSVDFEVKKATGENPFHTEGWENSLWVLLDYVNVVVHVFESETRHFYRLESLWADAVVKEYGVEYA